MNRSTFARNHWTPLLVASLIVSLVIVTRTTTIAAQVSTPEAETAYVDPEVRFAIPIPTNWQVQEHDGYVEIAASDGALSVVVVVIEAESADAGISQAWETVDPEFDATVPTGGRASPPVGAGVDEAVLITYDPGTESGLFAQAFGQKIGPEVYVLMLSGDVEAAQLRSIQIQRILNGFTIAALLTQGTPLASPAAV